MKRSTLIVLLMTMILLSGCTSVIEEEYEPHISIHALTPITLNGYDLYSSQGLFDIYSNEPDIQVSVSDDKAMMWNMLGINMRLSIFTSSGENETYSLNDTSVIAFRSPVSDNLLRYYKRLFPVINSDAIPNNNILEINSATDTIYFQYQTASIPSITITDTLVKN